MNRWVALAGPAALAVVVAGCLPAGTIDPGYGGGPGVVLPCHDDVVPGAALGVPGGPGAHAWTQVGGSALVGCGRGGDPVTVVSAWRPDGTPDPGFGTNGQVEIDQTGGTYQPPIRTADGAVLVLTDGFGTSDVRRLRPDGSVDTSFGDAPTPGATDLGEHVAVAAWARAGATTTLVSYTPPVACEPGEAGCTPRGGLTLRSFDATGPVDGGVRVDLDHLAAPAPGVPNPHLALLPTAAGFDMAGRIVVVGVTYDVDATDYESADAWTDRGVRAIRLVGGQLDPTYGTAGVAQVLPPSSSTFPAVAAIWGGEVVAVGPATVVRLDADGRPDVAFGDAGAADLSPLVGTPRSVAIDLRRRIVVGGLVDGQAVVVRHRVDGEVDGRFGDDGSVTFPVPGNALDARVHIPLAGIFVTVNHPPRPGGSTATMFHVGNL